MLRRKFALRFGALVVLPALPASGRIGMSDVARVREAEARLEQLDRRHGSAQLTDLATQYVQHVEYAMRHCTYGGRVQTHLHRAVSELCAKTAWLHYDSGRHAKARQWWDTGLRYALLARDPALQARIWTVVARQAVDLGHGAEAVAVARAALDATRNRRDPRLSALLHMRVALGHSLLAEKGRCGQSLHRAELELDRAPAEAPAWLEFCGPAEFTGQVALCSYNLGDYHRAAAADQESLALLRSTGYRRNEFATHVSRARGLLAAGELEEALAAGGDAVELLPEVRSPRWAAHLDRFRQDVQSRSPRKAAAFAHRYQQATT